MLCPRSRVGFRLKVLLIIVSVWDYLEILTFGLSNEKLDFYELWENIFYSKMLLVLMAGNNSVVVTKICDSIFDNVCCHVKREMSWLTCENVSALIHLITVHSVHFSMAGHIKYCCDQRIYPRKTFTEKSEGQIDTFYEIINIMKFEDKCYNG